MEQNELFRYTDPDGGSVSACYHWFCCNKLRYMDVDFNRKFSSLILNITAPFLILSSVMGEVLPKPEDIPPVLTAGLLSYVFLLSLLLLYQS